MNEPDNRLILALRTDNPMAEISLYCGSKQIAHYGWEAHRALAETIHTKIAEQLKVTDYELTDIKGLVIFRGPGSFTGLRIGASVMNAIAYSLQVPIVGSEGENWKIDGVAKILNSKDDKFVLPNYGSAAFVTQPKK